ncbi:hypothetical protein HMPREF1060_00630 [Parabacteroides merdae CL03T12C32]|uniref:Uncharacterized protein n=1 Tax=Parabacteroides merdae CL03T12C32 TaxID=999420 RepID=K5YPR3_9BACT|nr:hypothetical protein HMPREF1060_00630 [Parabacteroides merdae CL03T12C32]
MLMAKKMQFLLLFNKKAPSLRCPNISTKVEASAEHILCRHFLCPYINVL